MSRTGFRLGDCRFLLLGAAPLLLGQTPAPPPSQFDQAIEADAPTAPTNMPMAFHGGLAGVVVFASIDPSQCRAFILTTPKAQYRGRVCRAPPTGRWTIGPISGQTTAAVKALAHPMMLAAPAPAPALEMAMAPPPVAAKAPPPVAVAPPPAPSAAPPTSPNTTGAAPPPAAPAAAPAAAGPIAQASDEIKRQIQSIQIAYNKPTTISFDTDTVIVLVAESHDAAAGAATVAGAQGQAVQANVGLSAVVTAQLEGDSDQVQITPLTANTQAVTDFANTQWSWAVRAKQPGQATLTLNVFDDVKVGGRNALYEIETYTNQFPVQISWLSEAKYQFQQIAPIWQGLGIATPVALIGGFVAWLRRPRRSGPSPATPGGG
jgi:hypothetical protein